MSPSTGLLENPHTDVHRQSSVLHKPQRLWLHLVLFLLTLFTTTALGMRYMFNFKQGFFPLSTDEDIFPFSWIAHNLHSLPLGLPFSITLLAFLLAHEMGHYFACRFYRVRCTLPYVLPAPTLSGTAGAVIRLRSRIRSRSALIVIGSSGPLCGFFVVLISTIIGFLYSKPQIGEIPPALYFRFNAPVLMTTIHDILARFNPHTAPLLLTVPHPILVASWVGILITSLNLIPAGQLDGGHILYAISPRVHKVATQIIIGALFLAGTVYWLGWFLWAVLLMLPGMKHPPVPDDDPVKPWQFALIPVCLIVFCLTATVQPFTNTSLLDWMNKVHWGFSIH